MKKLIVIRSCYKHNTAPMNRLVSMLHGFDEQGIEVELVFAYPNKDNDDFDASVFKHVRVNNLWNNRKVRNKLLKYLLSFWDIRRYARNIEEGRKVFLSGGSEYMPFFASRKQLSVYHERTEHYNVVKLKPSCLQKWYLKSIPKLHGMFVISTSLRDAYLNIGAKNVVIVNMTVDANRFAGLKKQDLSEKYIAYCGTASNNKDGVDDLIKAFSIVHKEKPTLRLVIMGKAPRKEDATGNYALVQRLGIMDAVDFKGIVPAEQMPQMLKNAEIVALARPDSIQAQCGFPTKLGEYLLTENPVVVTRVGDIPLFLEDGKSALLAEQHNPEDFAAKMLWALNHEDEARLIGQEGARVAMREFNYKIETEKIINTIFPEGR